MDDSVDDRLEEAASIMASMSFYLSEALEFRKHAIWMQSKNTLDTSDDSVSIRIRELIAKQKEFIQKIKKQKKKKK